MKGRGSQRVEKNIGIRKERKGRWRGRPRDDCWNFRVRSQEFIMEEEGNKPRDGSLNYCLNANWTWVQKKRKGGL